MKNRSALILAVAVAFLSSCGSNDAKKNETEGQATTTPPPVSGVDPDPTDSIPADGYAAYNSNIQAADLIRKALIETVLKDELSSIPADQRKFKYHALDLNNDSKEEYFVTLTGNYFCGTGGCSFYIIGPDGKLISEFSVSEFPLTLANSTTDGWKDLLIKSNGKTHILKIKEGKYPSNPSVAPVYTGDVPATPAVLNVYDSAYPSFTF